MLSLLQEILRVEQSLGEPDENLGSEGGRNTGMRNALVDCTVHLQCHVYCAVSTVGPFSITESLSSFRGLPLYRLVDCYTARV